MKITLIKVGKPAHSEIRDLVEEYATRIRPVNPIELVEIKIQEEAKVSMDVISPHLKAGFLLVALDEKGKEFSSIEFANKLKAWRDDPGVKGLVIVVGGPYGLDDGVRKSAHLLWSLSCATLQGDIAWLVATEQLYRATTILKGTKYHH